ncbi:hypothetical protein [Terrihabitans rhizophilus]|uniref:Uncharacterized protein n=1 Tax=Terrihabitans rhizophilus TaxID=3092662 RepID=A0ABU4RMS6_9HYPH|nr:hypothetical protein [Terrihabitans sp. PJ23]MDX6805528.1 hypothetical protein [Terrihabitans sp. PJ23]
MCESCASPDDDEALPSFSITPALVGVMRDIEADLPGRRVSEEAWQVFFGAESGGIGWGDLERIARSREAAALFLSLAGDHNWTTR